jgi:hypothetical protein
VQRALDHEKPVVPLRVEDVQPVQSLAYYLGPVHWLDALTPPLDAHLKQLRVAVKALLQAPPGQRAAGELRQPRRQSPPTARRIGFRFVLGAIVAVAAAAGTVAWLASSAHTPVASPKPAESLQSGGIEGAFGGTMECAKLPWTNAPLRAAVSISIKAGNATFIRDVYSGDGARKTGIEQGTGTFDSDGVLQIATSWVSQTSRFDGSYAGRLSAAGGNLSGQQILLVNNAPHERPCTIIVRKVGEL